MKQALARALATLRSTSTQRSSQLNMHPESFQAHSSRQSASLGLHSQGMKHACSTGAMNAGEHKSCVESAAHPRKHSAVHIVEANISCLGASLYTHPLPLNFGYTDLHAHLFTTSDANVDMNQSSPARSNQSNLTQLQMVMGITRSWHPHDCWNWGRRR